MPHQATSRPPVILLGGSTNALSIARSLGRTGVPIIMLLNDGDSAGYTRYCTHLYQIDSSGNRKQSCLQILRSLRDKFSGAVIFPCDDDAIEMVAENRIELGRHFLLDDLPSELAFSLLDKRETLKMAQRVGLDVPRFHDAETEDDIARIRDSVEYPVIIKPIHSHLFQKRFPGRKFFLAANADELVHDLAQTVRAGIKCMVTEKIPGPDTTLSSYYTYVDEDGEQLFEYTKKVIRRKPKNEGLGCSHVSVWDEETADLGRRFFKGIDFRGLGNIEFKRDERDGKLKVIECNTRFTAAQELLVACGIDIAQIIYNRLIGAPVPQISSYEQGTILFYPFRDFAAYRELRRLGELSLWGWLRSVLFRRRVYPYFQWSDPLPAVKRFQYMTAKAKKKKSTPVQLAQPEAPT